MIDTRPPLARVDDDLRLAWGELRAARQQWAAQPNAHTLHVADLAEHHLNRLLEHRFKLTH